MQPMESTGNGQLIMPSPHSIGGIGGQWKGQASPSATQDSGIMQPMGSMGPGQLVMPSPYSIGGRGGQGAGTAKAVERRVKRRRGMLRLRFCCWTILSLQPPELYLYPSCHLCLICPPHCVLARFIFYLVALVKVLQPHRIGPLFPFTICV